MEEPRYIDDDELFGRPKQKKTRYVWQIPKTEFQRRILYACNKRKYFSVKKEEECSRVIAIEKAMMPLTSGIISKYPTEWVDNCIDWVGKKRREGELIPLTSLLSFIENEDKKNSFVSKWQQKNRNTKIYDLSDDETPDIFKMD